MLYFFSSPIFNFSRLLLELTLSRIFISINWPSIFSEAKKYKNLLIKSLKCKNSEFDDNPEITAYIQVKDLTNKNNDDVFIFNGWTFSSSPTINPFDHPIYNIWLMKCY